MSSSPVVFRPTGVGGRETGCTPACLTKRAPQLFFRLSHIEKEQEARHLALGRAAIALGRKVLADNPRPNLPPIARYNTKEPPPQEPDGGRMRMAVDRKAMVTHERQHLERQRLERRHLSAADVHIAKAERVIREQITTLEKLRCD